MTVITPTTTGPIYLRNLCAPFFDNSRRHPQNPALVFDDRPISNADMISQIDFTIDALQGCGIKPGDRVAYLGWNHPMLLITLLATARMGAIFLPLNPRSSDVEANHILNDCAASAVIAGPEFQPLIDGIRKDLPCEVYLGIEKGSTDWTVLNSGEIEGSDGISRHPIKQTLTDDVAVLLYTSGTTGRPKGVMITHGNVWSHSLNLRLQLNLHSQTTLLAMAPMFHIGSLAMALAAIVVGGKVVVLSAFDTSTVYRAITTWNVSLTFGVPTMLQALEHHPMFSTTDISNVTVIVGGSPVPVSMLETWSRMGVRIQQVYGMTEGGGSMLDADKGLEKIGSAGLPLPLNEIELRTIDTGQVINVSDKDGQIWMRGPTITKGYWNLPEETVEAFDEDRWLASGDVGRWDSDGYLYIVDRIKDMIISGGVNVYPAEVEKVLSDHPGIVSAAVIGLPDNKWGERVTAVIVTETSQSLSADEVIEFCQQSLSGYKVPRQVEFTTSLPEGPTGKVLKRELRSKYI